MELHGENGLFMKIVRREIPADIVYEDEHTLAFLDIHPNTPGHTLVIPKKPFRNVFDIDAESYGRVMETVRKIAPAVRDAVGAKGVHINSNHEPEAGQEVFHLHVHIIPRLAKDFTFCWDKLELSEEERKKIAEEVRGRVAG